ncbi:MAG: hypothetical protein ACKVOO_09625 [Burkholderiaceae bacterium]
MKTHLPLLACAIFLSTTSFAQLITGLSVEPAQIKAGESVKATVALDILSGVNCGLRLSWDDGQAEDINLLDAKNIPFAATHAYAQPGTYELTVEPLSIAGKPRCGGRRQTATLVVAAIATAAAPAPTTTASATPASASAACPTGWKMTRSGVNKRTQAFNCFAAPRTAVPTPKLVCPDGLRYFEDARRGLLGCRR